MTLNVGDKVRITDERIKSWEDCDDPSNWVPEAPQLFRRGRVFTITEIDDYEDGAAKYTIDGGMGGGWRISKIVKHVELPEELFTL